MPSVGAGVSLAGSLIGGSRASKGAAAGAKQAAFNPYNITSGFGSSTFNRKAGTGTSALSPEYQDQRDYYLSQADFFNNQLNAFRPPTRADFTTGSVGPSTAEQLSQNLLSNQWNNTVPGRYRNTHGDKEVYNLNLPNGMGMKIFTGPGNTSESVKKELESALQNVKTSEDFVKEVDRLKAEGKLYSEYGDAGGWGRRGQITGTWKDPTESDGSGLMFDQEGYDAARSSYKPPEQTIYDRLFKLSEGNEALEKSGLESRLFAQGMLGSTGGGHRLNAQADAANTRDLARQQESVSLAEQIQNMIQARGINASNQAMGIDQAALENLRLGISAGGGNVAAGGITAQNAANQGGAIANAFSSFGQNAGGLFGGSGGSSSNSPLSGNAASVFDYDWSKY